MWGLNLGDHGHNDDDPGRFYHIIARRVAGMPARRGDGREWGWVLVEAVMGETNL